MQFKYKFTQIKDDKIPMLEVRVEDPATGVAFNYPAMLDSGAFTNVFHSELAGLLGIDLNRLKEIPFGGVKDAPPMKGKVCGLKLKVIQDKHTFEFNAPVIFSDEVSNSGEGLLGRRGFFDYFDEVVFNFKKNEFYLRKT